MTASIYTQHRAAFANVAAFVVMSHHKRDDIVATVAFKYPRDGAGRLYAYVHWLGTPMERGHASGGGYDKHSAACASAAEKLAAALPSTLYADGTPHHGESDRTLYADFIQAMREDGGRRWDDALRAAGFVVRQAV
jgi:hypothetical protein